MRGKAGVYELASNYLRLKPDATVDVLPVDEQFWPNLMGGKLGDFANEFLVTRFDFAEDWPTWEVHPNGDEIVFLLSGQAEFHMESPAGETSLVTLDVPGTYVFVQQGYWHTAKIKQLASMLFITAGEGTLNKPL